MTVQLGYAVQLNSRKQMTPEPGSIPIAKATVGSALPPINDAALAAMVAPYSAQGAKSNVQQYRGPAWVNDQGLACIVMLAPDDRLVRRVRQERSCVFIGWRWNDEPSAFFSLTLGVTGNTPRPHARWMRPSEDPVVKALRREGRFLITVTTALGATTGWMDAAFDRDTQTHGRGVPALDRMWGFPTPGISYSNIHERFDPERREPYNSEGADEISLWAEPESEFWSTMRHSGPWAGDLTVQDRARAAWGAKALQLRERAAGMVQVMKERQTLDGREPLVDERGEWIQKDAFRDRLRVLAERAPSVGAWLVAVAGPAPDAKAAYDAAYRVLNTPYDLFCMLDKLLELLHDIGDEALIHAMQANYEAALLDARITDSGAKRPWLANSPEGYGLLLRADGFNLEAPLEDIENTWASASEADSLIELGIRVGPNDFVVPFEQVCAAFESLALEGSPEDAMDRARELLQEAQEARQWSIPWGARVEVTLGPFVAVRIFEQAGEFSCHFLDVNDRYFLVSVGLQRRPPRAVSTRLVRRRADDGALLWNEDAEASLALVAAAIVRDFVVVEQRESVFTSRPMRRRIRGRDLRTVIYLPRVRYDRLDMAAVRSADTAEDAAAVRARHPVGHHLRRAGNASAAQRFLAQRYGINVPEGFTFVRPHERGGVPEEERIRVYRSRSASRMIFQELATAPTGTRPAWFDFEKDCAHLLAARGMRVIHQAAQRDGDGGVDLYAVDAAGVCWVVQCKCWSPHRPVGPDVVRELVGAIASADRGKGTQSRGMIITTSRLTDGALAEASAQGFEVIQGEDLSALSR